MKQKIKTALQQKYNSTVQGGIKLGLGEDAFERVASVAETFITDESKIADFVNAESTLILLKGFQAEGDKVRTELNGKIKDLETKLNESKPNDDGANPNETKPQESTTPQDIAAIVQNAVAAAVKPLQDKLTQMEAEATSKSTVSAAKEAFLANDYVKNYTDEANDAWELVMEIYQATGSKMTVDELQQKAMGYFNKAVSRKGVDTSVPFKGGQGENPTEKQDFSDMRQRLIDRGLLHNDGDSAN